MHKNTITTETPTVQKFGATATSAPAPFGDKGDVAALLKCCRRSVDLYLSRGLPHLKLGKRRVRFDLDEVREWAKREFGTRRNGKENGGQAQ